MKNKSLIQVLSNITWLLFDKIFILCMNLVVVFVVANHYGPAIYGEYQYALNIVLILEVIVQLIDKRVVKKKYEANDDDQIVFLSTIVKVILSTIALLAGCLLILIMDNDKVLNAMIIVLLLESIIKNLRFGMENRFEYIFLSKKIVIASNVGLFLGTIFQLLAVYFNISIVVIALIQLFTTCISLGILYFQYRSSFKPKKLLCKVDVNLVKEIIVESLPLAIASAAATIYTKCDTVMLGTLLTATEVGIYSIAAKIISTIQMLIVPIQTTIFPKMLEWHNNIEKYEKYYIKISAIATWVCIVGVCLSFIVLPYILLFLKPDYLPALQVYKILSIGSVFTYNAVLRSSHFTITNNGKILMCSQVVTVIVNVILNFVFINWIGMIGAAMATAFSQFISLFLSNLFFKEARFVFRCQIKAFNPKYIFKR